MEPSVEIFRAADGIHWTPSAHRFLTCALLSHIALATGEGLPNLPTNVKLKNGLTRMSADEYNDMVKNYTDDVEVPGKDRRIFRIKTHF